MSTRFDDPKRSLETEEILNHNKMNQLRFDFLFNLFSSQCISGKVVLELAPYNGWFSELLLKSNCRELDLVENFPDAVQMLSEKFFNEINTGVISLYNEDVHYVLPKLKQNRYDTIICTGLLYHSPHLFWLLENMAQLKAEYILIETFLSEQSIQLVAGDRVNQAGMRQSAIQTVPFNVNVSKDILIRCMDSLGYKVKKEMKKSDIKTDLVLNPYWKDYLNKWIEQQAAIWFEKF